MTMAKRGRLGVAASLLSLLFCFSSILPSPRVFFAPVAPFQVLSSVSPPNESGTELFQLVAASAAPEGAGRAERLLKYAEQRAQNAEEELKRFRETHEYSMRACGEASQRKQHELDSCQEQSESLRRMYNNLQVTKSSLEKEVHSLQSQLATANVAGGKGASAGEGSAAVDAETARLRADLKKLQEKLQDTEEQHLSEIANLQAKVRELLMQHERMRMQQGRGEGGGTSRGSESERYLISLNAVKTLFMDVGKLYYTIGERMLSLVPAEWWERAATMKMELEVMAAPYINAVHQKVCIPLTPYMERSKAFIVSTVHPICSAGVHRIVRAAKTLSDDMLPAINARLDAALQPIFAKHPDVEAIIPAGLGDRLAVFVFLLVLTYVVALISFRYVLFPVIGFFCFRRKSSSTSKRNRTAGGSSASSQAKRFIPSGATGSGNIAQNPTLAYSLGGGSSKKEQQHQNPSRPFPFTEKFGNGPPNMKKV